MKEKLLRHIDEVDGEPLHYTACGLDDVYLLSGYKRHETAHGLGVSVKDVDDLHRAIADHLVREKKALTGKEFRFLRKYLALTQVNIGEILGVSSQTVARWEKGQTELDGPAEAAMRILVLHSLNALPVAVTDFLRALAAKDDSLDAIKQFFTTSDDGWVALAEAA